MKRRLLLWGIPLVVLVVLLAPLWILWCPGVQPWRRHAYRKLLYGQIVRQVVGPNASQEKAIERLADYMQTHLWTPGWAAPDDGTSADHLIRGIGWCDDQVKIYASLLATRNIPVRYAMLLEANGNSPHTIAEVWDGHHWGAYDVLFGLRFTDAQGRPLTLEDLSSHPALLDAQPAMASLRRQLPAEAQVIHGAYDRALPLAVPPRRSAPGTTRMTVFDRLLLAYARFGGPRFVTWYQDQYLGAHSAHVISPAERLTLARHWHLAGRAEEARRAYLQCIGDASGPLEASEARFWLGLLEWELDADPAAAKRIWQALITDEPDSRWTPIAWYYMGRCAEALGARAEAEAWYAKSSNVGPAAWLPLARLRESPRHRNTL